ncbi:MAG: GTP-binding protein [Candidatus Lokiarchaeota archaeon]|nr:GTP-binding protein [Candidatus Lokiarchaeota archaeon]
MVSNSDFSWKIVTGGAGGVGKTTFLFRYLTNQFVANTALTVGVQLHSHTVERNGKKIAMIIWDLGGQDRFRFLQDSYVRGAAAGMICFDISNIGTMLQIKDWVGMYRKSGSPAMPILLVGTKLDIADEEAQKQAEKEATSLVKELDLTGYIATSSRWGKNVEEAINSLIDVLLVHKLGGNGAQGTTSVIN